MHFLILSKIVVILLRSFRPRVLTKHLEVTHFAHSHQHLTHSLPPTLYPNQYRMASKANNNVDDPGAFPAREWLRKMVVGKNVAFETRKQGATAGDRVYGLLFLTTPEGEQLNLAVESVKNGHATPKVFGGVAVDSDENGDAAAAAEGGTDPVNDYDQQLQAAFSAAKEAAVGVHSAAPLVRTLSTAGEDFETLALVESTKKLCQEQKVKCVIEYVFDGSRVRCHVTDPQMAPAGMQYGSFTLFLAGITCPRVGNPRLTPPTQDEPFAVEARQFVELRLLHRELDITLHGTDKSGICAVGTSSSSER
jgi:staphylococcal nuclease domain-containing protein 1